VTDFKLPFPGETTKGGFYAFAGPADRHPRQKDPPPQAGESTHPRRRELHRRRNPPVAQSGGFLVCVGGRALSPDDHSFIIGFGSAQSRHIPDKPELASPVRRVRRDPLAGMSMRLSGKVHSRKPRVVGTCSTVRSPTSPPKKGGRPPSLPAGGGTFSFESPRNSCSPSFSRIENPRPVTDTQDAARRPARRTYAWLAPL